MGDIEGLFPGDPLFWAWVALVRRNESSGANSHQCPLQPNTRVTGVRAVGVNPRKLGVLLAHRTLTILFPNSGLHRSVFMSIHAKIIAASAAVASILVAGTAHAGEAHTVPEPATWALVGLAAVIGIVASRNRRK
jgi:hypothetical protein